MVRKKTKNSHTWMGFEPGNSELNPTDLPYTPQRQLTLRVLKHDVVLQVQRTAYFSIMF